MRCSLMTNLPLLSVLHEKGQLRLRGPRFGCGAPFALRAVFRSLNIMVRFRLFKRINL